MVDSCLCSDSIFPYVQVDSHVNCLFWCVCVREYSNVGRRFLRKIPSSMASSGGVCSLGLKADGGFYGSCDVCVCASRDTVEGMVGGWMEGAPPCQALCPLIDWSINRA